MTALNAAFSSSDVVGAFAAFAAARLAAVAFGAEPPA
jgi:hypothetical protein